MGKISCDVCADLMPLVKDNVASEDSVELVNEHVAECEQCKGMFMLGDEIVDAPLDSTKILSKIKAKITLILLAIIIIAALIGMILTSGGGLFYNAIIFPIIGGLGYLFFNKRWYLVPIFLFVLTIIWTVLRDCLVWNISIEQVLAVALSGVMWGVLFAMLCLVGVAISGLLQYAFTKEEE